MDPRYGRTVRYDTPSWLNAPQQPSYNHPQAQYYPAQNPQQPSPTMSNGAMSPQQVYARQPQPMVVIPQKPPYGAYQNQRPPPQHVPQHHNVQHPRQGQYVQSQTTQSQQHVNSAPRSQTQQSHPSSLVAQLQHYASSPPRPQPRQSPVSLAPFAQVHVQIPASSPARPPQQWQLDGTADVPPQRQQPRPKQPKPRPQQSQPRPQQARPAAPSKPQLPPTPDAEPVITHKPSMNSGSPVDYQQLLLSLADEYIQAAHGMGESALLSEDESQMEHYHQLIASGLGCMETVLNNWKLPPRQEATLRLRYATLLYQETENDLEAETILGKGIPLCERNKLLDLKYGMHHLLARVVAKSNPRAAVKSLDRLIPDVEAYQHVSWVYAFRFLRVFLTLQDPSNQAAASANPQKASADGPLHHHAAMQNLRAISALADNQSDRAVFATAATLEALVHIKHDSSSDGIEQAQRAIASARSLQLHKPVSDLVQMRALLECIDLACSIHTYNKEDARAKVKSMQEIMEGMKSNSTRDDGTFRVLVENSSTAQSGQYTGGVIEKHENGMDLLVFSWLSNREIYLLGYYFSGVAQMIQTMGSPKAEKYFRQGRRAVTDSMSSSDTFSQSLGKASIALSWQQLLKSCMCLQMVLCHCMVPQYAVAKGRLSEASNCLSVYPSFQPILDYLTGVIAQCEGDLQSALTHYQSPLLNLPESASKSTTANQDLAMLASMNSLLILRDPSHPQYHLAAPLLSRLEALCHNHPNRSYASALNLIKSIVVGRDEAMVKVKQHLSYALNIAKENSNQQLMCICLNLLTAKFFTGIVGSQSQQSAKASLKTAERNLNPLWQAVANGMMADSLDMHGNKSEATQTREVALSKMAGLPEPLGEKCEAGNA